MATGFQFPQIKLEPLSKNAGDSLTIKSETAKIRKIIKSRCSTISVKMGQGTARAWVQIDGSQDKFGRFTPTEKRCLRTFGIQTGLGGGTQIMPNEKPFFIKNRRLPKDRSKYKHW